MIKIKKEIETSIIWGVKIKHHKAGRKSWERYRCMLVRESLTDMLTFKQTPEGGRGVGYGGT